MHVVIVNHDIEDFAKWKAVFDGFDHGSLDVRFARINRNVENPNNVTIVQGFDSAEAAQALLANSSLQAAVASAGVTSEPRIELYEEVDAIEY
jgi:translation initiation factor 1 (eIF-1/SUI1)